MLNAYGTHKVGTNIYSERMVAEDVKDFIEGTNSPFANTEGKKVPYNSTTHKCPVDINDKDTWTFTHKPLLNKFKTYFYDKYKLDLFDW